jgi:hypothetical protein
MQQNEPQVACRVHAANRSVAMPRIYAYRGPAPTLPEGYHGLYGHVSLKACLKPPSPLQHEMSPLGQSGSRQTPAPRPLPMSESATTEVEHLLESRVSVAGGFLTWPEPS